MTRPQHIAGETFHGRRGQIANAFRYRVDYLLLEPESDVPLPWLFSRNRRNVTALWDRDHGGPRGEGRGAPWVREVLAENGLAEATSGRLLLLAQPRVWGHVFNPVSFWLAHDDDGNLRAVIAEVTNTYGDRHSYLANRADHGVLTAADEITAQKIFHVSPFQPVQGTYRFRFGIGEDRIAIRIAYETDDEGLLATLTGNRRVLTNRSILGAALRRPMGSRRVLGLIHWQALKLWWKGAPFRSRPQPPTQEVSR